MSTKTALDQWASEAVAMVLCECLHAVADEMDALSKGLRGEVWWHAPTGIDLAQMRYPRRLVEGPKRAADDSK